MGASLSSARAIATRCRWPPDSSTPSSPTSVSSPSGISLTKRIGVGTANRIGDQRRLRVGQAAVGDVAPQTAIEERDLLGHQRNLAAQRLQRIILETGSPSIRI